LFRRAAVVIALAVAVQGVPSLASGPVVISPILRTTSLAHDQVVGLTAERMVGVTWTGGAPTVTLRWHTRSGWTPWAVAEDDTADSPDGRPGTAPQWRPPTADRVQIRTAGTVQGLRLVRVTDGVARRVFGATADASAATGREVLGSVHPRSDWGADESQRRRAPSYAGAVSAVVVHHTVNANGYAPHDVPALIRADYAYHVQTRGWADLGYNLLVDQFGGIWEGRAGGLGRATIGTHAQGFNTGTLGVAMIGDMTRTTASHDAEKAFARVIGYAARTWGWDPAGTVTLTSQGSPRYASGQRVTLPRVFGHQQTGVTACPGSLQDRLPYLRQLSKVALGPAPRIGTPVVSGAPVHAPTPLVLDARLSLPAAWTVDITDPQGRSIVATARGTGTTPHLSWDGFSAGLPATPGTYAWTIKADDDFHDVVKLQGRVEVGLPLIG
jgi:hypothetical protein